MILLIIIFLILILILILIIRFPKGAPCRKPLAYANQRVFELLLDTAPAFAEDGNQSPP